MKFVRRHQVSPTAHQPMLARQGRGGQEAVVGRRGIELMRRLEGDGRAQEDDVATAPERRQAMERTHEIRAVVPCPAYARQDARVRGWNGGCGIEMPKKNVVSFSGKGREEREESEERIRHAYQIPVLPYLE